MKGQGSGAAFRVFSALALLAVALIPATAAGATPLFVWHGKGPFAWSEADNWLGGRAPSGTDGAVDLEFPLSACQSVPRQCPAMTDDVSGLSVQTLTLDGITVARPPAGSHEAPPVEPHPAAYRLDATKPLKLGGALHADIAEEGSGAEVQGATLTIEGSLEMTAANDWTVGPGNGGELALEGSLTGRHPLNVELLGNDALELPAKVETGPIAITGRPGSSGELSIGPGGEVNAVDREPLHLEDLSLRGSGVVGPLTLNDATLRIGEDNPGGILAVNGPLILDGSSTLEVRVPAIDQLRPYGAIVHGRADLGGARLDLVQGCPTPQSSYTLLEAEGGISGRLTALDGQPIEDGQTIGGEAIGCATAPLLRLEYRPDSVLLTAIVSPAETVSPPPTIASGPPAYSAAARATLASDLRWLGAGRRIGSILAGRGEDVALKAPRPGTFLIQWHVQTAGRTVLVASGRLELPGGGTGQLRIVLTRAGRVALRHSRHMRLNVLQRFVSSGMPTDLSQTILVLRR